MNTAITILSIGSAIAIGAMRPGPSFVMVARTAVASTRANGIAAARDGRRRNYWDGKRC